MVGRRPPGTETLREIAARHRRAYNTVRNQWAAHPDWPDPVGKDGRSKLYDTAAVDVVITRHFARPAAALEPRRLYTATELEDAGAGVTAGTIRADVSRGRWPVPDDTTDGVNRWRGSTATRALAARRGYHRRAEN